MAINTSKLRKQVVIYIVRNKSVNKNIYTASRQ